MMAALTPRKRKHSPVDSESFLSGSGTPVKKLAMDINWTTSPLAPRNVDRVVSHVRSSLNTCEADKENLYDSPLKSNFSTKRVHSPAIESRAASRQSPLKSPQPRSPFKPTVPTVLFYSKEKHYLTPLDRKALNEGKVLRKRSEETPEDQKDSNTRLRAPRSTLRMASRQVKALPRNPRKTKLEVLPAQLPEKCGHASKLKNGVPFKVLSFEAKPRPKLTMGAAFFCTRKKNHSAPRKQTLHANPIPAASRHLTKIDKLKRMDAKSEMPPARKGKVVLLECGNSQKGFDVPQEGHIQEADFKLNGEQLTITKRNLLDYKMATLQKTGVAQPNFVSPDIHAATALKDSITICSDSEAESSSEYEMDGDVEILSRENRTEVHKVCSRQIIYPIFSTPATTKKRPPPFHEDLASPLASNTPSNTVSTLPPLEHVQRQNKRKKELHKEENDQMIIDAGQKHFGAVTCKSCGMIYTAASPEDEADHAQYHQRFLEGIKFVGWKKERTVADYWDGKIVLILPDDPKYAIKKAEEVRELVDSELGFKQITMSCPSKTKTYLFVSNEKKIIGCLIAEPIKKAFRVLTDQIYRESQDNEVMDNQRAWRCSTKPESALCGISRIWVFSLLRRKGIASRMMDTVRGTFMYGSFLSIDEIAFSDPTPDGKLFATTYCKAPNFLVYNFIS